MGGSRRTIGLSIAVAMVMGLAGLSGCASAPVAAGLTTASLATGPSDTAQTTAPSPGTARPGTPADAQAPGDAAGLRTASTPDPEAMHQIIAEIEALGTLDPAARDELLRNLKQTDPSLWPLVAQQVRASVAWRRQAAQRQTGGPPADAVMPAQFTESVAPASQTGADAPSGSAASQELPAAAGTRPPLPGSVQLAAAHAPHANGPDDAATPPDQTTPSGADRPEDSNRSSERAARAASAHRAEAEAVAPRQSPGAHEPESSREGGSPLRDAIRSLESDVADLPKSDREFAEHARLRMLYLLAGERDEALAPIPSMAPAMQEFWSEQLFGLATLMGCELTSESSRQKAEAKQHLDTAVAKLGESCPLVVRNLAFATDIQSFGTYKPFAKYEFAPGQTVLLYAEVENFKSVDTAKGFHTATRSSYQIFDASGKRVAEHEFSPSEEYCRHPRRDFFIGYEFSLPQRIYPGKHVLQLTVADLNSQKIGQSMIEFTVEPNEE